MFKPTQRSSEVAALVGGLPAPAPVGASGADTTGGTTTASSGPHPPAPTPVLSGRRVRRVAS
eukprot:3016725-Prorocentrum_lima.AAC.1